MLFRTHLVFGILSWLVLEYFINMPFFVLAFVLIGSVLVDIDSLNSKMGRKFWFFSWVFRHRGFLHSLLGCLIVSLSFGAFSLWAGFGIFVGYFSHLFLDSFTKMGVALFWPLKLRVRGFVKSGSWAEDVLFSLGLIAFLLGAVYMIVFRGFGFFRL